MKNEEFNDFLRDRADSFELKPSSGSFDAVARKLKQKRKRRGVFFILPILLVAATATIFFATKDKQVNNTALKETNANEVSKEESALLPPATANAEGNITTSNNSSITVESGTNAISEKPLAAKTTSIKPFKTVKNTTTPQKTDESANSFDNAEETIIPKAIEAKIEKSKEANKAERSDNNITTLEKDKQQVKEKTQTVLEINSKEQQTKKKSKRTAKHDDSTCNCEDKKWAVRAWINPFSTTYSGSEAINAVESDPTVIPNQEQSFREEVFNNGFAGAISFERRLTKRLNLGLGVGFSTWSLDVVNWTTQQRKDSVQESYFDSNTGTTVFTGNFMVINREVTTDSSSNNISFYNFQVPLQLRYALLQKKKWGIETQFNTVFTYNVARINNRRTYIPSGNQGNIQNSISAPETYPGEFRKFNLTLGVGLSAYYNLFDCVDVFGGIRHDRSLFTLTNSVTLKRRLIFTGIETGIRIKF